MSTNRSMRLPGPSRTRPSRASDGSAGWPSIAITQGAWPSSRSANTRGAGIDQPQAHAFAASHREIGAQRSVDQRHGARVRGIASRADDEHEIPIDSNGLRFLDDQRAMQPLIDLGGDAGVVPERAGIGRAEAV